MKSTPKTYKRLGVVIAMDHEIQNLVTRHGLASVRGIRSADIWEVSIGGLAVGFINSGIGKVNAAVATTRLIDKFACDHILVAGVSGALHDDLNIGDVVVATGAFQHDFDLRPLALAKGVLPGHTQVVIDGDSHLCDRIATAVELALQGSQDQFRNAKIVKGIVASGDKIISSESDKSNISAIVPEVQCVDMETGAVAQICQRENISWTALRVMSDAADSNFSIADVLAFAQNEASWLIAEALEILASPNSNRF